MTTTRSGDLSQSMTIRDTFADDARPGEGTGIAPAIDRLREWERHGSGRWGLGAAGDVTMLERRLAIVEAIVHDAAPAARAACAGEMRDVSADSHEKQGTGDAPVTEPMPKEKRAEVSDTLTEPVADSDELLAEYLLWKTRRCEPQPLAAGWRGENRADGSGNRQSPHPSPVRSSPVTDDRPATTAEPVAFAVYSHWYSTPHIAKNKQEAHRVRKGTDWIAPLYLQPQLTLTDAEREAISDAADLCEATAGQAHGQDNAAAWAACAATLRGMRERLRGGK